MKKIKYHYTPDEDYESLVDEEMANLKSMEMPSDPRVKDMAIKRLTAELRIQKRIAITELYIQNFLGECLCNFMDRDQVERVVETAIDDFDLKIVAANKGSSVLNGGGNA